MSKTQNNPKNGIKEIEVKEERKLPESVGRAWKVEESKCKGPETAVCSVFQTTAMKPKGTDRVYVESIRKHPSFFFFFFFKETRL